MIKVNEPRELAYVRGCEEAVINEMFDRMGEAAVEIDNIVRTSTSANRYCVLCLQEYPYHTDECKAGKIIEKMNVLIW